MKTMRMPQPRPRNESRTMMEDLDALLRFGCRPLSNVNRLAALRSAPRGSGEDAGGMCLACLLRPEPTRLPDRDYRRYDCARALLPRRVAPPQAARAAVERALAGE